jgi:hypothetical protein
VNFLKEAWINMKNIALLIVLFCLPATGFTRPSVDPRLEKLLGLSGDEKITVIAGFKQGELPKLSSNNPAQIQRFKMAEAQRSQANLLKTLEISAKGSDEIELTSLWISNIIIITAKPSLIRSLLKRDDLKSLHLEQEVNLIEPISVSEELHLEKGEVTYGLKKLNVPEVWQEFGITGKGVKVGILDTGYADHPEFKNRVILAKDFASDVPDNQPSDTKGHGSHCMGTIGGTNQSGTAIGVAPKVEFIVGKIFPDKGGATDAIILKAMQWMADPDGNPDTADFPRIVSNSWGKNRQKSYADEQPLWKAVTTWRQLGIVPVFAAGNRGPKAESVGTPAGYPHSFAVGATGKKDEIARFSSRGPSTWLDRETMKPDISAPGRDILSVRHTGGYIIFSGTSMAAPHISGISALILEANPNLSVDAVERIIIDTSKDLGLPGKDHRFGYGRVNAYKAVDLALHGGSVKLRVKAGAYPVFLEMLASGKRYQANQNGEILLVLPEGSHRLRLISHGFKVQELLVEVQAKTVQKHSLQLQSLPSYKVEFEIHSLHGSKLNAKINFPELDPAPQARNPAATIFNLPEGSYKVIASSRGYGSKSLGFDVTGSQNYRFRLEKAHSILLIDDGGNSALASYYEDGLSSLGLKFDQIQNKNQDEIQGGDIMGYELLIWFTGDLGSRTLTAHERRFLRTYLESGGRLLLSGQDIGFNIRFSPFYTEVLGAKYLKDNAKKKKVRGQGLKFKLDGRDSANNQMFPDLIAAGQPDTTVLFKYGRKGAAALEHSYGKGKSIYLGFGFEGIRGEKDRTKVLSLIHSRLKPSRSDTLDRIALAFENDKRLYGDLIDRFKSRKENPVGWVSEISKRKDKAPFRFLLDQVQKVEE